MGRNFRNFAQIKLPSWLMGATHGFNQTADAHQPACDEVCAFISLPHPHPHRIVSPNAARSPSIAARCVNHILRPIGITNVHRPQVYIVSAMRALPSMIYRIVLPSGAFLARNACF